VRETEVCTSRSNVGYSKLTFTIASTILTSQTDSYLYIC